MVRQIDDYPWSSFKLNTQGAQDPLIDREENLVFAGLGTTAELRVVVYRDFARTLLEKDREEEVRRSLATNAPYISETFQKQIRELQSRRFRGRPSLPGVRSH